MAAQLMQRLIWFYEKISLWLPLTDILNLNSFVINYGISFVFPSFWKLSSTLFFVYILFYHPWSSSYITFFKGKKKKKRPISSFQNHSETCFRPSFKMNFNDFKMYIKLSIFLITKGVLRNDFNNHFKIISKTCIKLYSQNMYWLTIYSFWERHRPLLNVSFLVPMITW